MPAVIPLIIGTSAFAGGLAASKLKKKPLAPGPVTAPAAPQTPITPPVAPGADSDLQAKALTAGIRTRRKAMSGGILGPRPKGGTAPAFAPKTLIGY